jgi:hypothetical protein
MKIEKSRRVVESRPVCMDLYSQLASAILRRSSVVILSTVNNVTLD